MDNGFSGITIVSAFVFIASILVFSFGIPISAFYMYRLNRSRGWLLLAAGFAVCLIMDPIYYLIMYITLMTNHYFPGQLLIIPRWLIHFGSMAVALYGFIMIVKGEDGRNTTAYSEVFHCD